MEALKQAPIYIIYGQHDEDDPLSLITYANAIKSLLSDNSHGQVAVFIEDALGTRSDSNYIRLDVLNGELPTDALSRLDYMAQHHTRPTREQLARWKPRTFSRMNEFVLNQYRSLDTIAEEYPRRLLMIPEWQTPETHQELCDDEGEFRTLSSKRQAFLHAGSGDFSAALPIFKSSVNLTAELSTKRDTNILQIIKNGVSEEKVIGAVGFIGASHTQLSHTLTQEGYRVKSIFTPKENGVFLYDPYMVALRRKLFFPNTSVSEDGWMKVLAQMIIYEVSIAMIKGTSAPYTEQQISKMVWQATKGFTRDDVSKLQKDLRKSENVGDVIASVFNPE